MPPTTYQPTYTDRVVGAFGKIINPDPSRDAALKRKEAECIAKGGAWNADTQICTLPTIQEQPKQVPQAQPSPPLSVPEVFKNESGRNSGITLPNGNTFLGLGPDDVAKIAGLEQQKNAVPDGTLPVGTQANAFRQQQDVQRLVNLAQQGLLTPQELQAIQGSNPDIAQALGAGAIGVVPGLVGGAIGGAAVGAVAGGVGAIPGAVVGGIGGALTGFLSQIRSSIKGQQTEQFAADQTALTKGERYLRSLITDTNQNPQNAPQNIALFYQTLNMIDAAHAKTYRDSQEDLNVFLGNDGTEQLAKFEVFDTTMRQYYISQFNTALTAPNPQQILISADDITDGI